MATMEDKYKKMYPNVTNKALMDAIIQAGLNFGEPIAVPKMNAGSGIANATIQPDPTKQVNPSGNANSEILGGTIRDLLPAIFGVGAGLIGSKAGLRPNDALGLGITTLNTATSVQDTYRNNRQKYYGRLASKIVDGYVADSGGKIDPNLIYKKLQDEHPDIFKNINPADLLSEKMAERNKVIDLTSREYVSDFQKRNAYDESKSKAFQSGGEIISPDISVGPNISYRYANYNSMVKRLVDAVGNRYTNDSSDGKIKFDHREDYDQFVNLIKSTLETGPDGQKYNYDMGQVLKYIKPPETDTKSAKNEADVEYKKALTSLAKARESEVKRRSQSGTKPGSSSKQTWRQMYDSVNRAYIGDAADVLELTNILYDRDVGNIDNATAVQLSKEILPRLKDAQDKPDWLMQLLTGQGGAGKKETIKLE